MPIIPLVPVREIELKGLSGEFIQFLELLRQVTLNLTTGSDFVFSNGSRAMVTDATGALAESAVTAAELLYLDGVTSNVQTQLNAKYDKAGGKIGGATDYAEFESDGTLVFAAGARVYNDIQFGISGGKVPAANFPTFEAFTTNTQEYSFAVNDYIDLACNELPHWWAEGTDLSAHIHVAPKTTNSSGASQYAKFTVYIAYADANEVYVETSVPGEVEIPNGTLALTHLFVSCTALSLPNNLIGTQCKLRIKRIAATSGTEYADSVFVTQVGFHALQDTIGSRSIATK